MTHNSDLFGKVLGICLYPLNQNLISSLAMSITTLLATLTLNCTDCKSGYFRWGKIWQKCWKDISGGANFHDSTPISFIKAYGFYLGEGNVHKED